MIGSVVQASAGLAIAARKPISRLPLNTAGGMAPALGMARTLRVKELLTLSTARGSHGFLRYKFVNVADKLNQMVPH